MKTTLKLLSGFWIATALLSCTSYPSVHSDPAKNNQASFQRDAIDCAQAYPDSGTGVAIKQRIGCMNLKGWY